MAAQRSRPGRTLVLFLLAIVLMYVGLGINNVWKPKLGLDLQGGTRITLTASTSTGEAITPEKMREAAGIVDNRVNASGVSESEVTVQGDDQIVVEIPGRERKDLVNTVKQQAQLRFRLVAANAVGSPLPQPSPSPSGSPSASPSGSPSASPKGSPAPNPTANPQESTSPAGRAPAMAPTPSPKPKPSSSPKPSANPSPSTAPQPSAAPVPTDKSTIAAQLAWMRNPDAASLAKFQSFTCESAGQQVDDPAKPLLACDENGNKYLLSPAIIEGTQLDGADYGIPQNDVNYAVTLDFNGDASKKFAEVTTSMSGTQELFAIVLDGEVLSAPQVNSPITNGSAQITGDFKATEAQSLANSLKYGALPLKFDVPLETVEGPTLAADQLDAGLLAGGVGLLLVILYCLFYYRALGIVVVASLAAAAAITYAAVIFLSETAGFTLTLPGIAGLIVAVGITADSFIVYFERLRDELRGGKTLRVAVEAAWVRARATCVAADAVSLLAAVVLYIFAIGVVKGFAFALGISTVIDLVVFFLFTKPMVTWLARFTMFRTGSKWSGLSDEHTGRKAAPIRTAAAGGAR
jgi:preprotein translocase subunit SecD